MLIRRLLIALFLLFPAKGFAADSTVAALAAASALAGSELFYCVQSSADKKCTATQLSTFVLTAPNIGVATATSINGVGLTGSGTLTSTASTSIGAGQYLGIAAATAATAGNIGEIVTASVAIGSAVSLTNNTAATVTSVSLTAGEWDVSGVVIYSHNGTTTFTEADCNISSTTNTIDSALGTYSSLVWNSTTTFSGANPAVLCPVVRKSISGTTPIFLIAFSTFGVSTNSAYGFIRATRVH